MDWDVAIRRQQGALLRLLGVLVAMAGPSGRMKREAWLAVLRVLRPAESAVRRLIVIAARGLVVPMASGQKRMLPDFGVLAPKDSARAPSFPLLDRRKRFAELAPPPLRRNGPRLSVIGEDEPGFAPAPRPDDGMIEAGRVRARIAALQAVLADVPKQARRLVRMQARPSTKPRLSPLRPGWPPGYRKDGVRPVDVLLADCHALAFYALNSGARPPPHGASWFFRGGPAR